MTEVQATPFAAPAANLAEGADAPGSPETGYVMAPGDSFTGTLSVGDWDWVAIPLQAGESYAISLDGAGAAPVPDPYLRLYDAQGWLVAENDDADHGAGDLTSALVFTVPVTGTYYIEAASYGDAYAGGYSISVAPAATPALPPEGSLDDLAAYLTDGYWQDQGVGRHRFASNSLEVDLDALGAADQQMARWALEAWAAVADLQFTEVASGADITFTDTPGGAHSDYTSQGGTTISAGVNVPAGWGVRYGTSADAYTFSTYMHEIGHALGLGHQGDYNGAASYPDDATFANDSWQLSLMSYFDQAQNTSVEASRASLLTPMIVDIIAMQDLYGAPAGGITAGDTIWGEGSTLPGYFGDLFGALFGTPEPAVYSGEPVALTIYDESGWDVLALSSDVAAQIVDLRPEGISDILGLQGNLVIARDTYIEVFLAGTGDDSITGHLKGNRIEAGAGDDSVSALDGGDTVLGGAGADSLNGNNGSDSLEGGEGHDTIWGGNGADTVLGGAGDDLLEGRDHADVLSGGDGADDILGNRGTDSLDGGEGNDTLSGGGGSDTLDGGADDDLAEGKDGADHVRGGDGDDHVAGNLGADTLEGGAGDDSLNGGDGDDVLEGGDGADYLEGKGAKDLLKGGGQADTLIGNNGEDTLDGGGGNDLLQAGGGDDTLDGGTGNDTLTGNAGQDCFLFTGGDDVITDFKNDADRLLFDAALWGGAALEAEEILDTYGSYAAGTVVFTFAAASLTLEGLSGLEILQDDIGLI